jgi:hypothetical protein
LNFEKIEKFAPYGALSCRLEFLSFGTLSQAIRIKNMNRWVQFFTLCLMLKFASAQSLQHQTDRQSEKSCADTVFQCASSITPVFLPDGSLFVVGISGDSVFVAKSIDLGNTWSPSNVIAHHHQTLDKGADARAQIIADNNGHVMIAYAYFKDQRWNSKINVTHSNDFGEHFSAVKPIFQASVSERFPVLLYKSGSRVALAWIDKRLVAQRQQKGLKTNGASIAYSESTDWGETFEPDTWIETNSCECCRLGMSNGSEDEVWVTYRSIFSGGERDHALVGIDRNKNFKISSRVSNDLWQTDVCPHQGPSIAVSPSGPIHLAWFTLGLKRKGLFYTKTSDGGKTFSDPMPLGRSQFNPSRPYLLTMDHRVWLVWKEYDGEETMVRWMVSDDEGVSWSAPSTLMAAKGYTDHPLLIAHDNHVYLSWLTRQFGYQMKAIGD